MPALFLVASIVAQVHDFRPWSGTYEGDRISQSIDALNRSVQDQTKEIERIEESRRLQEAIRSFTPIPSITRLEPSPPSPRSSDDWFERMTAIPPPRPKPSTVVVQSPSVDLAPLYVLAGALVVAVGMVCGTVIFLRTRSVAPALKPAEPSKIPGEFGETSPVDLSPLAVVMIAVSVCGSVAILLIAFVSTYGP